MPLDLRGVKRHAKQYVELEARTKVTKVTFVKHFELFGREDILLSVDTTDKKFPSWWVIGGSTPMNLYSKKDFPEPDVAYSLHGQEKGGQIYFLPAFRGRPRLRRLIGWPMIPATFATNVSEPTTIPRCTPWRNVCRSVSRPVCITHSL